MRGGIFNSEEEVSISHTLAQMKMNKFEFQIKPEINHFEERRYLITFSSILSLV
jgi:hypothetical protein